MTIVAWLYIAAGAVGFAYHLPELIRTPLQQSHLLVELIRVLAIVSGVFLLRGRNWARWMAIAWIAFHTGVSAFHEFSEFAIHCALLVVIAWLLLRPAAARYFRAASL